MPHTRLEIDPDEQALRSAIAPVVDNPDLDDWLLNTPDAALLHFSAPLEMLTFQYFLDPPQGDHLIRAAREMIKTAGPYMNDYPPSLSGALQRLAETLYGNGEAL